MVASCPSCHARYKVADDKIKGRGARITCPKCSHKFTVYRDKVGEPAADIGSRDFRRLGLTWRAKRGVGIHYEFHDLDTLREHLASGRLDGASRLTYDNQTWTPIDSIADLEAWFGDVWKRGEKGQIQVATEREGGDREEDASDAPTTIVGRGSSLASEIRLAVSAEATPPPAVSRTSRPAPAPPTGPASDPGLLELESDGTPAPAPERPDLAAVAMAPSVSRAVPAPESTEAPPPAPLEPTPIGEGPRASAPRPPPVPPAVPTSAANPGPSTSVIWGLAVLVAIGGLIAVSTC